MSEQITDTDTIVRRLRDGVPCSDSVGYPCKSRDARSGCDCAIAADKMESDAKVIAALREALMRIAEHTNFHSDFPHDIPNIQLFAHRAVNEQKVEK